jgi:hypothetical protein
MEAPSNKKRKIEEEEEEEEQSDQSDNESGDESSNASAEDQNNAKKCNKCDNGRILSVTSRGNDNNYYTLPNGKEGEGYLPTFHRALGDSDGLSINLCIDCGAIQGLNLTDLQRNVQRIMDE